jgi:predicted heme/steroid binding protein
MKKKGLILAAMALLIAVLAVGCASKDAEVAATTPAEATATAEAVATAEATVAAESTAEASGQLELTIEELAAYDGKNGNPAYVAVDGVIYDVTDVSQWTGGKHNGYTAGQDLTEAIKKAPHGTSKLEGLPVVGKIKAN